MKPAVIVSILIGLATGPAFGQTPAAAPRPAAAAPAPTSAAATAAPRKRITPPATAESRSAAALALSSEPVFDPESYQRLKEALLDYADLQVRGGWPTLPADAKLAPGASGPNVALLRTRLVITEDLAPEKQSGDAYDNDVTEAVKHFQLRHGLDATGAVGAQTLKALNIPVAKRIQQLQASIERLVGMDFSFGERYVVVNIPAAYAEAVAHDKVERRYRVIVGKIDKPSPTLTASIVNVDLNPTWTVPLSITKNEIINRMRRDPNYLSRMHMRVLGARDAEMDPGSVDWSSDRSPNFTIRQDAGPSNALGFVRIDMPNPYSVYMHDTNQRNLFNDDYRFDSHGCTRVDNVRDLAAWLLQDTPNWGRAEIDAAIATGETKEVRLKSKVPVAWVYLTAWMMRDGTVQFRDDVYVQDDSPVALTGEQAKLVDQARAGFVPARQTIEHAAHLDNR